MRLRWPLIFWLLFFTASCLLIWLLSDASRFVTGVVVPVDGGFSVFSGV